MRYPLLRGLLLAFRLFRFLSSYCMTNLRYFRLFITDVRLLLRFLRNDLHSHGQLFFRTSFSIVVDRLTFTRLPLHVRPLGFEDNRDGFGLAWWHFFLLRVRDYFSLSFREDRLTISFVRSILGPVRVLFHLKRLSFDAHFAVLMSNCSNDLFRCSSSVLEFILGGLFRFPLQGRKGEVFSST